MDSVKPNRVVVAAGLFLIVLLVQSAGVAAPNSTKHADQYVGGSDGTTVCREFEAEGEKAANCPTGTRVYQFRHPHATSIKVELQDHVNPDPIAGRVCIDTSGDSDCNDAGEFSIRFCGTLYVDHMPAGWKSFTIGAGGPVTQASGCPLGSQAVGGVVGVIEATLADSPVPRT